MDFKEEVLLNYVRKELNSGKKNISIPASLVTAVSDEVLLEIKRWCKLSNVTISIKANT